MSSIIDKGWDLVMAILCLFLMVAGISYLSDHLDFGRTIVALIAILSVILIPVEIYKWIKDWHQYGTANWHSQWKMRQLVIHREAYLEYIEIHAITMGCLSSAEGRISSRKDISTLVDGIANSSKLSARFPEFNKEYDEYFEWLTDQSVLVAAINSNKSKE